MLTGAQRALETPTGDPHAATVPVSVTSKGWRGADHPVRPEGHYPDASSTAVLQPPVPPSRISEFHPCVLQPDLLIFDGMIVLRYRGREVSSEDLAFIRQLLLDHPDATRRALSFELCKAWEWVQQNGALRDGVCRGLLLALHRALHIQLPPPTRSSTKAPWTRLTPKPVDLDSTPLARAKSCSGIGSRSCFFLLRHSANARSSSSSVSSMIVKTS